MAGQRAGIVEGLKRAGDIAASGGVTITLEPLSVEPGQPRRALDRAVDCFPVIAEVNHPNVKVCFDFYHLQRTEGNLTVNLREGLAKGLIKIVQIGHARPTRAGHRGNQLSVPVRRAAPAQLPRLPRHGDGHVEHAGARDGGGEEDGGRKLRQVMPKTWRVPASNVPICPHCQKI